VVIFVEPTRGVDWFSAIPQGDPRASNSSEQKSHLISPTCGNHGDLGRMLVARGGRIVERGNGSGPTQSRKI